MDDETGGFRRIARPDTVVLSASQTSIGFGAFTDLTRWH
jgi:hypothetical protein